MEKNITIDNLLNYAGISKKTKRLFYSLTSKEDRDNLVRAFLCDGCFAMRCEAEKVTDYRFANLYTAVICLALCLRGFEGAEDFLPMLIEDSFAACPKKYRRYLSNSYNSFMMYAMKQSIADGNKAMAIGVDVSKHFAA